MTIREQTQTIERLTPQPLCRFERAQPRPPQAGSAGPAAPVLPARPRPHPAQQGVPPLKAEDAGLSLPGGGTTTARRLTHTLEVSQIARTIARALRLNEDLTEAIALGHDLGHTPFGHAGERALNRLLPRRVYPLPPEPALSSISWKRTAGASTSPGRCRNGIITHTTGTWARTLEGWRRPLCGPHRLFETMISRMRSRPAC